MKVSVYEAKSKLSQMINKALEGEEVIITRNGVDTARIVPAAKAAKNDAWIGSWKGKALIHDSFYAPLNEDETVNYLTGDVGSPFPE
jgi:prevent-host-death family protein